MGSSKPTKTKAVATSHDKAEMVCSKLVVLYHQVSTSRCCMMMQERLRETVHHHERRIGKLEQELEFGRNVQSKMQNEVRVDIFAFMGN